MPYYRFLIKNNREVPELFHLDHFIITEDDNSNWLYIRLLSETNALEFLNSNPALSQFEETDIKEHIDWNEEWSKHAPDYKNGYINVDLSKYTSLSQQFPILQLNAGPGFGDLSHTTTRLSLALMAPYVQDKEVIDIGCGSGILSLAAIILGARSVCGLDIDSDSITHAKQNALLNGMESEVQFLHTADFTYQPSSDIVIVMNMIRSQQQEAWASLPQLHERRAVCITSGILISEKEQYLEECMQRKWQLVEETRQDDWLAFIYHI